MKKVKAFTLVELIIVMAIFSGIAVGAIAMVRPAMKLFNNTSQLEKASADVDNIRRYIEDNLRYADRLVNCVGYDNFDDIVKDSYTYKYYDSVSDSIFPNDRVDQPVLTYFKEQYFPYLSPSSVYVMEIDNGDIFTAGIMGKITIYKVDFSDGSLDFESEASSSYYSKYSFNINFGVAIPPPPTNLPDTWGLSDSLRNMYIDVFKNRSSADDDGKFFDELHSASSHYSTSALNLSNLELKLDIDIGVKANGTTVYDTDFSRLDTIENPTPVANPKYYFIYTLPEIINPKYE